MSSISAGTTSTTGLVATSDTTGSLLLKTGASATTAVTIDTSQNVTFAGAVSTTGNQTVTGNLTTTGYVSAPNTFGFKNRIINGGMVIDQRNAGASVTPTDFQYTLDRYYFRVSQASKLTTQQNAGAVTPPVGFTNYLGVTSSSAYSITSTDYFNVIQSIEGFNTADLQWGTANAKTVTLSFQVYSSLTGTFGGAINNSGNTRSYPFSYSIPTANTWTTISITIAGDTTGTWVGATNGVGVLVRFSLGTGTTYVGTAGAWAAAAYLSATGATSVVGTNGATFYITGVQLEKGTVATSFDFRDYGRELILCQRYAYAVNSAYTGFGNGTTVVDAACMFPVTMRSSPTLTSGTVVMTAFGTGGAFTQSSASNSFPNSVTQNGATLRFSNFTSLTSNAVYVVNNNAAGTVTAYSSFLSAEL